MGGNKFVVQEGHFHIADHSRYVLTGWYPDEDLGAQALGVYLGGRQLPISVLSFDDESVRQKYAKYDKKVTKEYVVIVQLPEKQKRGRLSLRLADGSRVWECGMARLGRLRGKLNYRITNVQTTGASCVLTGWVASEKQIKLNVYDRGKTPVQCEISHFPKPDVALEYRESQELFDSGFSVTIPVNGRRKLVLQLTDGEIAVNHRFSPAEGGHLLFYLKKAHYYMQRNGVKQAFRRAVNELYELVGDTGNYMKWRKKNMPQARELERQKKEQPQPSPCVYCVTPYEDTHHFMALAASLEKQTYANWKWLVACTGAEKEQLEGRLQGQDILGRIHFVPVEGQAQYEQRIACAVGALCADEDVKGWFLLAEPSDMLAPDAFYACVRFLHMHPSADMLYTDEDTVSEDGRMFSEPSFKPDFNLDLLLSTNYLGHMVWLHTSLVRALAPWNPLYMQDAAYDYYVRAVQHAAQVVHLPRVLYHVRACRRQTEFAAKQFLDAYYAGLGIPATVKPSQTPGIYHTVYAWQEHPLVSINIPNKDHIDDLDTCVQSLLNKCTYDNYEIVIIENNSTQESTYEYYRKIQEQDARVRVVYWEEEFNYSKITNFGVRHSRGDYILLLNNDTEVITPDFIEEMLGYCMRDDVGICGARLFYFDDTIQHAGVIIGLGGICGEGFQGFPRENGGYQNRIFCPQDYSAVTAACMMTKKSVFLEVGGMDEALQVAYNDIDYCLKVRESGRLVVYNPFAMLHHYEYKSRGTENTAAKLTRYHKEVDIFTTRWAKLISDGDPYYNPNLTRRYQDFSLRRIELL